ncbi:hypothetical protein FLL45_18225 [Aliikangiella marina]|uniref:MFS transporter n=1 Tax=Aliikangiella marina TaxID=1712262 RepID=A0A545T4Q9_9GAMM|nr:hypothetical protein [Aliikangiella marina]TQV72158.1 hypothetical protein FLL45_18225 [Aliikangiella marina]
MKNISLRKVLFLNASFSVVCAFDLIVFSELIAGYMGSFSPLVLEFIGFGLIPFAVFVAWVALKTNNPKLVKEIVYMDRSWVVGSIVLLVFASNYLNLIGITIVMLVAVIVAGFSEIQNRLLTDSIKLT